MTLHATAPKLVRFFDKTGSEIYDTYLSVIPRKDDVVTLDIPAFKTGGKVSFVSHNITETKGPQGCDPKIVHTVHVYLVPVHA